MYNLLIMGLLAQVSLGAKSVFSGQFWMDVWRAVRTSVIAAAGEILLVILLLIIARLALFKFVDRVLQSVMKIDSIEEQRKRAARVLTLQTLVKSIASYVLFFVALLMILRAMHVDPVPLLATASVAGLAVGFGAQRLVRDVISGFFIILENQYSVGDRVTVVGVTGKIEELGMRMTRLRDDAGVLYFISNGDINNVANHTRAEKVAQTGDEQASCSD